MDLSTRIFVAGHRGLVGSACTRLLQGRGFRNLLLPGRSQLDLTDQRQVDAFFQAERPEVVVLAAARVGGIVANSTYPADFIRDNLLIQTLVLDAAYRHGTRKLAYLGSSCIYPRLAPQPIPEDALLSGPLEPTNEPYAIAKIAGLKMAQAYQKQYGFSTLCLMPTNLYGPGDNFDLESSHVLPALLRRFHEARERGDGQVTLWGTGTPRREFLHVDDLAEAVLFLLERHDSSDTLNIGTGQDITIDELARLVARVVGYQGEIAYDSTRPDGTPRKLLDVSRIHALGWRHRISLSEGLVSTYRWFVENQAVSSGNPA